MLTVRLSYTKWVRNLTQLLHHYRFRLLIVLFLFMAFDLGMLMVVLESQEPRANIVTLGDGIWWAVTTMTGVGYGDVYPVTGWGRTVGMVLEIIGVVVFGLIVGNIAVAMFSTRDQFYWRRLDRRLDEMEKQLAKIDKMGSYQLRNGDRKKKPV